jgi:hypothetical protein
MYLKIEKCANQVHLVTLLNKAILDIRYFNNQYIFDTSEVVGVCYVPEFIEELMEPLTMEKFKKRTSSITILLQNDSLIIEFFLDTIPVSEIPYIKTLNDRIVAAWINFKQQLMPDGNLHTQIS